MNVSTTPEREALRATAAELVRREVVPHLQDWEDAGDIPRALHRRAGELGLLGVGFAEDVGGSGGDLLDSVAMQEAMFDAGASSGLMAGLLTSGIALPHIAASGDADLVDRFVRPTLAGDLIGSLAITEPGGGSDVARLRTTAARDGDHYVVDGAKTFITSGVRADFVTVAVTSIQAATGAGVQSLGAGNVVHDAVLVLDGAAARAGFDALSGEIHATVKSGVIADTGFIRATVNDRLRADPETGLGLWSQGFGGWTDLDSDGNAAAFAQRSGGMIVGADQMVGDWRLGLLASYGHAGFAVDDRSSTGAADSYTIGAYGSRDLGALHLRGGLSYGWHDIGTDRSVAVGRFADSLSADYAASSLQAFGEVGYSIDTELATFEPFIGLANVSVFTGSYGEAGGAAALQGGGTVSNVTYATLGLRAERAITLGETKGKAHAMVGWQHAFGETGPSTSHSFAGGDSFTVTGAGLNADTAVVEAGVDFELNDSTTIGLSYNGQFGSAGASHAVKASLRVRF